MQSEQIISLPAQQAPCEENYLKKMLILPLPPSETAQIEEKPQKNEIQICESSEKPENSSKQENSQKPENLPGEPVLTDVKPTEIVKEERNVVQEGEILEGKIGNSEIENQKQACDVQNVSCSQDFLFQSERKSQNSDKNEKPLSMQILENAATEVKNKENEVQESPLVYVEPSQKIQQDHLAEKSLLFHRDYDKIQPIVLTFLEEISILDETQICQKLNVISLNAPDDQPTFIFKLTNKQIDYYYEELSGNKKCELKPYVTIYPEFTDEEIIQRILTFVEPMIKKPELESSHRRRVDRLYQSLYPFSKEYAQKIASKQLDKKNENNNSKGKKQLQPISGPFEVHESSEKIQFSVASQEHVFHQGSSFGECEAKVQEERRKKKESPRKKKLGIEEIRSFLMKNLPSKVAQKLKLMKNAELEAMYFGIMNNQEQKSIKSQRQDEIIEVKPSKKIIIEKNGEPHEKRKMEKLKEYVKEIGVYLNLIQELISSQEV